MVHREIISNGGSHVFNNVFNVWLDKYYVLHIIYTPRDPKSSGKIKVLNREIKQILEMIKNLNRTVWLTNLDDCVWSYCTALKAAIGMFAYQLLLGKSFTCLKS